MGHVSASFSATIRVRLEDRPGAFADLAQAIGDAGGSLDAIDLVRVEPGPQDSRRDRARRERRASRAGSSAAVRALPGVEVEHVSDRTFLMHLGGKIEVQPKAPLKTRDDLSMAYTPGVARVCQAIAAIRTTSGTSRSSATRSRSSPTEPPCSGSATSARRQRCP